MYSKEKSFPMLEPAMTEAGNTTQQADFQMFNYKNEKKGEGEKEGWMEISA